MSTNEKDLIVGGQAVVEGVMMRTPNAYAVAVRKADGSITFTGATLPKWSDRVPLLRLPLLRGAAVLIQSMALGVKALNYSAGEAFNEAEQTETVAVATLTPAVVEGEADFAGITGGMPGLLPFPTAKRPADEMKHGATTSASVAGSIIFAMVFNVLLFIVAPLVLTNALFIAAGWAAPPPVTANNTTVVTTTSGATANGTAAAATDAADQAWYARAWQGAGYYLHPVRPSVSFNLVDGVIRMSFFLIMIVSFSLLKDETLALRGEADDLVGEARDERHERDARQQIVGQRIKLDDGEERDGDEHHHHQEARAATRVLARLHPRVFDC